MKEKEIVKKKKDACCPPLHGTESCCKIESLLTVDERGQMVLPKSIRDKAGIKPGDKLALLTWETDGKICCISLIKADEVAELAKNKLGPMMKEMT